MVSMDLPTKLSDLVELAAKDLELCSKDPHYKVDMSQWHTAGKGSCRVCLAGALMAKTLRVDPHETLEDYDLQSSYEEYLQAFYALDHVAYGAYPDGYYVDLNDTEGPLDQSYQEEVLDPHYIGYEYNPELFWKYTQKVVQYLRERGL